MTDEERIAYRDGKIEAYEAILVKIENQYITPGQRLGLVAELAQALTTYPRAEGKLKFWSEGYKEALQLLRIKFDDR